MFIGLVVCISTVVIAICNAVNVPIIDVSPLFGSDEAAKRSVALEIGGAFAEVGFIVITGHHVPNEIINSAWTVTHEFFDLPLEEKKQYIKPQHEYPFGYTQVGGEVLSAGKNVELDTSNAYHNAPDLKEMFSIGPKDPLAGQPPRLFPGNPSQFAAAWDAYYEAINNLANTILSAFEIALDLPPGFFAAFTDHHSSALRALNYPSLDGQPPIPGQLRASAHTDYGTITILRADGPGLQVSKDVDVPQWHDVPYVPDGFIVNLGDLMKRWTNDKVIKCLLDFEEH